MRIVLDKLSKSFDDTKVIEYLDLTIEDGEMLALQAEIRSWLR